MYSKNAMANAKIDLSLSAKAFFNDLRKFAATGYLTGVNSSADLGTKSKILSEMINLPKYKDIQNQLRGAHGVVNFVTGNGYKPLIESLLRVVYSGSNNDMYNFGGIGTSDDMFVDCKYAFGDEIAKDPEKMTSASRRFEAMLRGSPKPITPEEFSFKSAPGGPVQNSLHSNRPLSQQDMLGALGISLDDNPENDYVKFRNALRKYEMHKVELKAIKDAMNEAKGLSGDGSSEAKYEKLLHEFKRTRMSMQTLYDFILRLGYSRGYFIRDGFDSTPERQNDGFLQFDPVLKIHSEYEKLQSTNKIVSQQVSANLPQEDQLAHTRNVILQVAPIMESFFKQLYSYETTDKRLINLRKEMANLMGVELDKNRNVVIKQTCVARQSDLHTRTRFYHLINSFLNILNSHGRNMILTNFDQSIFYMQGKDGSESTIYDNGVLSRFRADYKDMQRSQIDDYNMVEKPLGAEVHRRDMNKRLLLFVTEKPLPSDYVDYTIEMYSNTVDQAEAEIIVNAYLEPYKKIMTKITTLKYIGDAIKDDKEKDLNQRLKQVTYDGDRVGKHLARVPVDVKYKMEQLIIGMGQDEAISLVKSSIDQAISVEKDENGSVTSMSLDSKSLLGSLRNVINKKRSSESFGITVLEPSIDKFEQYATKKGSDWSAVVGTTKKQFDVLFDLSREIARDEALIQTYTQQLKIEKNPEKRAAIEELLMASQHDLNECLEGKKTQQDAIPHLYLLYGKSGVGKSVFADALGTMMGYLVYDVNLSNQRNMWLGNTEANARKLINTILNSRQVVFVIDEIDRQIGGGGQGPQGAGSQANVHQADKAVVNMLLSTFDKQRDTLVANDVYMVITTNYLKDIDTALKKRMDIIQEVPLPDTAEDYMAMLQTFLSVEKNKRPGSALFSSQSANTQEAWEETVNLFATLKLEPIAAELAKKRLDYRQVSLLLKQMFAQHMQWTMSEKFNAKGIEFPMTGMPLTTENVIEAIRYSQVGTVEGESDIPKIGTYEVISNRMKQLEEAKANNDWEEFESVDPRTGAKRKGKKPKQNYYDIMSGKVAPSGKKPDDVRVRYEDEQFFDPETGQMVTKSRFVPDDQEELETLQGQDFKPIEDEEVKSSTDYYYNFLKKQGILFNNKEQNNTQQVGDKSQQSEKKELKKYIGHYMIDNNIMVAPAGGDVEPWIPSGLKIQ